MSQNKLGLYIRANYQRRTDSIATRMLRASQKVNDMLQLIDWGKGTGNEEECC